MPAMKFLASHESSTRGTFDFPIELYYVDKMHPRYEMPFHWHMGFELMLVLSGLGNTDDANTWIQLLADKKRRYLKDNLVSLKHSIGKYDKEIVNKTLEICIDRSIYNAAGFADVAKTLYGQMAVKVVPAKTNMTTLRKIAMEPQTRDINSYQSIMSW
jgi:hypothetical protein